MSNVTALFPLVPSGTLMTGRPTPPLPPGWVEVEDWCLDRDEDWVSERWVGEVLREDDLHIVLGATGPDGRPGELTFRKTKRLEIRGPGR